MVFLKAHLSHRMNDPEYLIKCLIEFIQYESILKKDDDGDKLSAEEFYENKEGDKEEISDGSLYKLPPTKEADLVEYQKRIKKIQERIEQREKAFKKLSEAERKKYDIKFELSKNPIPKVSLDFLNAIKYANLNPEWGKGASKEFTELYSKDKLENEESKRLNKLKEKLITRARNQKFKGKLPYVYKVPKLVPKGEVKSRTVSVKTILSTLDEKDDAKIVDMLNDILKNPQYKEYLKLAGQTKSKGSGKYNIGTSQGDKTSAISSVLSGKKTVSGNLKEFLNTVGFVEQEKIYNDLISDLKSAQRLIQSNKFKDATTGKKFGKKYSTIASSINKIEKVITELNQRLNQARKTRVKEVSVEKPGKATDKINENTLAFFRELEEDINILSNDLKRLDKRDAMVKFLDGKNKKLIIELLLRIDDDVEPAKQDYPEFGERTAGIQLDPSKKVRGISGEELKDKMPKTDAEKDKLRDERIKQRKEMEDRKQRGFYEAARDANLVEQRRAGNISDVFANRRQKIKRSRVDPKSSIRKAEKIEVENKYYTSFDIKGKGTKANLVERKFPYNKTQYSNFSTLQSLKNKIKKVLDSKEGEVKIRDVIKDIGSELAGINITSSDKRKRGRSALDRLKESKKKKPTVREFGARAFTVPLQTLSVIESLVDEQISDQKLFLQNFAIGEKRNYGWTIREYKGTTEDNISLAFMEIKDLVSQSTGKGPDAKIEASEEDIQGIKDYYSFLKEMLTQKKILGNLPQIKTEFVEIKDSKEKQLNEILERINSKNIEESMKIISEVSNKINGMKAQYLKLTKRYIDDKIKLDKLSAPKKEKGYDELNNATFIAEKMIEKLTTEVPIKDKKGKVTKIKFNILYNKANDEAKLKEVLNDIIQSNKLNDANEDFLLEAMINTWRTLTNDLSKSDIMNRVPYRLIELYRAESKKIPEKEGGVFVVDGSGNLEELTNPQLIERQQKIVDKHEKTLIRFDNVILRELEKLSKTEEVKGIEFKSSGFWSPEKEFGPKDEEGNRTVVGTRPAKMLSFNQYIKLSDADKKTTEYRPNQGPSFSYVDILIDGKIQHQGLVLELMQNNFKISIDAYSDYKKLKREVEDLDKKIKKLHSTIEKKLEKLKKVLEEQQGEEE